MDFVVVAEDTSVSRHFSDLKTGFELQVISLPLPFPGLVMVSLLLYRHSNSICYSTI